ncbi:MAG: M20 family metallopeptidase [Finegoldia sp.]|nr:M20 family metallopeptidase [Finegoldia sp.]
MDVISEVKKVEADLIKWRRHLHENPEVGFDLDQTCDFVEERLREFGIEDIDRKFKGAVVAYINPDNDKKTIALRADMDALPVPELTNLEFASKNEGKMHACGHDAHTAQLLAAAKVLQDHKDEIDGKIMLIFQPAEELGSGSVEIANSEEFAKVDEVLGCHDGCLFGDGKDMGALIFAKGPTMATMDKFTIDIKGRGAHGSTPSMSIDPIAIAAYMITSIQEIISREISPLDPSVISFGVINSGSAFNIIPETAHLEGTTRTLTPEIRDYVEKRLGEVAEGVAKTFRATIEYKFFRQPPPLINTPEIAEKVMESAKKILADKVVEMEKPLMGGEDFAFYLEKKPGAFFFLNNPKEIEGNVYAHHNPRFAMTEEVMYEVPAVMVQYVMDELGK